MKSWFLWERTKSMIRIYAEKKNQSSLCRSSFRSVAGLLICKIIARLAFHDDHKTKRKIDFNISSLSVAKMKSFSVGKKLMRYWCNWHFSSFKCTVFSLKCLRSQDHSLFSPPTFVFLSISRSDICPEIFRYHNHFYFFQIFV